MAKIQGPLCSIGAIGSFAGLITYRATPTGQYAQRAKTRAGPRSGPQKSESADMSAAASAWNAATPQTKITWRAFANARRQNTFAFFFLYWKTQQLDHAQWDLSTIILNADPPQSVDGTPLFFPLEPLETIRPTTPMTGISKLSAIPARLGQLRLTQATPGRS